jgi:hypothetical protein
VENDSRNTARRPGIASAFRPVEGKATAWITSKAARDNSTGDTTDTKSEEDVATAKSSPRDRDCDSVWSFPERFQYHCTPRTSTGALEAPAARDPAETTSEFNTSTPAVGMASERNSTLREDVEECKEDDDDIFSLAVRSSPTTATKIAVRMDQRMEADRNTMSITWAAYGLA